MQSFDRDFDDESYDEAEESLRVIYTDKEGASYFPFEESKPPHY